MNDLWSFMNYLDVLSALDEYNLLSVGRGLVPSRVPVTEVNIICRFPCRARMRWEARDTRIGVAGCDW